MESRANSDLFFLPDEKFDFDVSLSPASSKGDEDEDAVFIGPLSHQERCVSVCMASQLEDSSCATRGSWSPLTEDQLEAVRQEAHRLATQLQNGEPRQLQDEDGVTTDGTTNGEEFVQDSKAKLDALVQTARVLSPIKRQTFCVQDSPMKQLPPAVQRQLQRAKGTNASSSTRAVTPIKRTSTRSASATTAPPSRPSTTASSSRPTTRLSTSSPATSARSQPKTALRGKAVLGVGSVLPSKPAVAPTSCSVGKSKVEKTRLQPPSKAVGSWRRSQTLRPSSRAESYEDLLSDSASVASDISDSSLNSSQVGKRTLAPPTKNVMRNPSGVKAPPTRATNRKNTSSSSSSVSSFNSSMSLSPAKGKLNSSLNRSLSGSTGPAPSSINRPASHSSKPRCSTVFAAAPEPASSSTANRRSLSTRMLPEAERTKPARSTPLKRAEATPLKGMPAKRVLGRSASVSTSVRTQSVLKAMAKPEAAVLPTPSRDDVSKVLKPKRPMSASNVDSLPMTPSLQMKARRPSALPTPMRHRMSGIPTPTSHTRAARMPPTFDLNSAPRSAKKESSVSPAPIVAQEAEPDNTPDIQPFCLEEEQLPSEPSPTSPPCSPPQLDQSESTDSGPPSPGQSEPSKNLIELETMEENHTKSQEVLLLDLPAPALQPQEKLLIDLTNTPDLIRTSTTTCTTSQLIDLSSPLIKWSPEDKRENNAPLINLSF